MPTLSLDEAASMLKTTATLVLSPDELREITGGYDRQSDQLRVLRERGFFRAAVLKGQLVLERSHAEAVLERQANPPPPPVERINPVEPPSRYPGSGLERFHQEQRAVAAQRKDEERLAAIAAQQFAIEHRDEIAAANAELEAERLEVRAALLRFHANKRRAVKLQRTAQWASDEAIRAIYAEAARLTAATGTPHHVDHEIPLQGELVSGLHVETNLQIITGSENSRKRNHFAIEP